MVGASRYTYEPTDDAEGLPWIRVRDGGGVSPGVWLRKLRSRMWPFLVEMASGEL